MIRLTSSEPHIKAAVSVDEAVAHMRMTDADIDSSYIQGLIDAATDFFEQATNQTYGVRVRHFELESERQNEQLLYLPLYHGELDYDAPLLMRVADDGAQMEATLSTEALRRGYVSWRDLGVCHEHSILTLTHGSDSVDPLARAGILMLVAHWYEHREAVDDGRTLNEVPLSVKSIIALIRRPIFA